MKNLKKLTFFLFILIKAALSFSQENLVPHSFPGLAINSQNDNSINQSHYSPNYIYIGDENEETFINPNGGQVVNLKAGKEINVSSNSHIKSNGHGNFHAYIEKSNIETVWYNPNSTPGWIGKHNRLELGFSLPSSITDQINLFIANGNGGINPFDPEQIDFRVKLTSPTGRQIDRFA